MPPGDTKLPVVVWPAQWVDVLRGKKSRAMGTVNDC